jgi:predicted PurR-regulated permease PerM
MFLDIFIIARVFNILYTWLEHNIIDNILNFSRIFGNMLVLISVVIFLLILAYITIKHLKKLPRFYSINITDIDGNNIILEGIRTKFRTYDAAKSFSEFYSDTYKEQYKFYVVGSNQRHTLGFLDIVSLPQRAFKVKRYKS